MVKGFTLRATGNNVEWGYRTANKNCNSVGAENAELENARTDWLWKADQV